MLNKTLKKLIKSKGYTNKSISEKLLNEYDYKISKESIAKYADGTRTPEPKMLVYLSKIFNVSVDYILGTEFNKLTKFIPLIGKSSCGTPQDYNLENYDAVPISPDIYNEGMYAVEAEGKSMSPKINDGNIVYCDPSQEVNNGNIVHYMVKGESGIKKYKINEPQTIVSLVPLNSDYDIVTVDQYENVDLRMVKVVGVVDTDF